MKKGLTTLILISTLSALTAQAVIVEFSVVGVASNARINGVDYTDVEFEFDVLLDSEKFFLDGTRFYPEANYRPVYSMNFPGIADLGRAVPGSRDLISVDQIEGSTSQFVVDFTASGTGLILHSNEALFKNAENFGDYSFTELVSEDLSYYYFTMNRHSVFEDGTLSGFQSRDFVLAIADNGSIGKPVVIAPTNAVPEPSIVAVLGLTAVAGLAYIRRRKR